MKGTGGMSGNRQGSEGLTLLVELGRARDERVRVCDGEWWTERNEK